MGLPLEEVPCAQCGRPFAPAKRGHRFCSPDCRHQGEREPGDRPPADPEQVRWLFDEARDPEERVGADDWHPGPPEFAELDSFDLLEKRRRWCTSLRDRGLL